MHDFHDLTSTDLKEWLEGVGEPAFRAKQIFEWVYRRSVVDWSAMSDLGKDLRDSLANSFHLRVLQERERHEEADVACLTWGLRDGKATQSVLYPKRRELVVSTQVGCPMRCSFCASGSEGGIRNLRASEILQQVLLAGQKIHLVTLAGMGEPFKNLDHVIRTIQQLMHKDVFGLPADQITVSTIGIPEGIVELAKQKLMVKLVIGLHAPNEALRSQLVPLTKQFPLESLIEAAETYWQQVHLPITFDYVMLEDVNDSPDQAHELAHLLKRLRCTVRLVNYNPVRGVRYQAASKKSIKQFRTILYGSGVDNILYEDPAAAIQAGLGQLDRF